MLLPEGQGGVEELVGEEGVQGLEGGEVGLHGAKGGVEGDGEGGRLRLQGPVGHPHQVDALGLPGPLQNGQSRPVGLGDAGGLQVGEEEDLRLLPLAGVGGPEGLQEGPGFLLPLGVGEARQAHRPFPFELGLFFPEPFLHFLGEEEARLLQGLHELLQLLFGHQDSVGLEDLLLDLLQGPPLH